jgi:zona occludens toxin
MAIDAYTGLPRSGKSYSVVKNVILPSLQEGREVHTNIPLTDLCTDKYPGLVHQLKPEWFKDLELFAAIPAGAVVVLDELWRRWPAGLKANNVNFADKEFLAEHGHNVDDNGNTTRVVLVTQDLSQISAFARDLVAMTYRTTKLDAVGADNRFRVDIYTGCVTGQKPPKNQLLRSTFDKYDPTIYGYYRSSTKSKTGDVGNESRADKRANIWKSPFILFSIIAPLVAIPLLGWYVSNLFFSGLGMVEPEPEPQAILQPMVNPDPPGYTSDIQPEYAPVTNTDKSSPVWKVSGYMLREKQKEGALPDLVILSSAVAGLRYMLASECERFPDGINWKCEVDGYTVTPWSGIGGYTDWADSSKLVNRTASTASVATSGSGTGDSPEARNTY